LNGLAIAWQATQGGTAFDVLLLCLVAFALLVCAGLTLVLNSIRSRTLLWMFSMAILIVTVWYNSKLLFEVAASC
jgi:hypothetical protein